MEKQKEIKNALAVHFMTVSFKNGEQLGYTKDLRTSDWPSALSCNVWSSLDVDFKPSNTMVTSEMLKRLMVLRLRKNADPKKLGKQTAVIQAGYNCKLNET